MFTLPIRFQSPLQFYGMEGLESYVKMNSKFDGVYYCFIYEPVLTPLGTKVEIKFRQIEKIIEYVRKYWCI